MYKTRIKSTSYKSSYTSGHGLALGLRSECTHFYQGTQNHLMCPSSPLDLDKPLFKQCHRPPHFYKYLEKTITCSRFIIIISTFSPVSLS